MTKPTARRLPPGVTFYLLASIVVSFLAGSSAPTPLYSIYQSQWHFSPITTTAVYGIYALAVLVALLVVGSLSDHVGRRPVLLTAIAVQALTMLVFADAGGVAQLIAARVLQGLSTGAAVGAVGAGMLDLDHARGTIANAVAPVLGTAIGGLLSGLLVQLLPYPTELVYLVLLGVFVLQGVGVALMAESSSRRPGALASMRLRFALPPQIRTPFLLAAPAIVAVWALGGFYGSLGPALTRLVSGSGSYVLGGLSLFTLAASGAGAVLLLRATATRTVLSLGTIALVAGVGTTLLALVAGSTVTFFVGTAIAGVGFGAGLQGAIRSVIPLAAPHERAGVLSLLYLVSYLAMGLPAVIGGFLVVDGGGLLTTAREYGAAVIALALLAMLGLARSSEPKTTAPQAIAVMRPQQELAGERR
ncbi:MAG: transporter [Frankiales bacterium]|nr:transporter [Frankiales bacterium]